MKNNQKKVIVQNLSTGKKHRVFKVVTIILAIILISMIGTVGLTYFVQEEEINFAIKNIGLFKTSQNKTLSEYFYLYLKSDNMMELYLGQEIH